MNKSILLSIRSEWVCEILNGHKTIEIRRKFPKDYVGWVYIYCTKHQPVVCNGKEKWMSPLFLTKEEMEINISKNLILSGKVVARFWCDKVEEIKFYNYDKIYETDNLTDEELRTKSCLSWFELNEYLNEKLGYAIYISKLEIFDKPKELSEFKKRNELEFWQWNSGWELYSPLTKAPQNYCYLEEL